MATGRLQGRQLGDTAIAAALDCARAGAQVIFLSDRGGKNHHLA